MGGNRAVTLQVDGVATCSTWSTTPAIDTVVQLADVRPGPVGPADAIGATQFPVPVLMQRTASPSRLVGGAAQRRWSPPRIDAQAPAQRSRAPVFRANTQLVSVDVIVRDGRGAVVRGLTAADFEVLEDGKPQEIRSFAFEEISRPPAGDRVGRAARRRAGADGRRQQGEDAGAAPARAAAAAAPDAEARRSR